MNIPYGRHRVTNSLPELDCNPSVSQIQELVLSETNRQRPDEIAQMGLDRDPATSIPRIGHIVTKGYGHFALALSGY